MAFEPAGTTPPGGPFPPAAENRSKVKAATLEITYATAGRRVWAFVLDLFILLLVSRLGHAGGAFGWVLFGALLIVYVVGLPAEGGTPGMRLMSLRLVRVNGEQPGIGHAVVRAIVFPGSVLALGAGLLWMLDQLRCQTWHDLAAGTVVVRERRVRTIAAWTSDRPWASTDHGA